MALSNIGYEVMVFGNYIKSYGARGDDVKYHWIGPSTTRTFSKTKSYGTWVASADVEVGTRLTMRPEATLGFASGPVIETLLSNTLTGFAEARARVATITGSIDLITINPTLRSEIYLVENMDQMEFTPTMEQRVYFDIKGPKGRIKVKIAGVKTYTIARCDSNLNSRIKCLEEI